MIEFKNRMRKVQYLLTQKIGREPTEEELAEHLQVGLEKIQEMLRLSPDTLSLELPVGEDADHSLGDLVEDDELLTPSEIEPKAAQTAD